MDIRLVSDDGDVLRLKAVAGLVHGAPFPSPPPVHDLLGSDGYARCALLSLAEISIIDTLGMSWLLILHKRFCLAGGRLIFHSVRPQVMEFLEIVRFDNVLHIAEDEAAAAALLREGDSTGSPTRPSRSVLASLR